MATSAGGAESIGNLKAQAAQINQQLLAEQLQILGDRQQYLSLTATVAADNASIARIDQSIAAVSQRIATDRVQVVRDATLEYMEADLVTSSSPIFGTDSVAAENRAEYEQLAIGDTNVALAQLHTDQGSLRRAQTLLRQKEAADSAAQSEAAAVLADAQAKAHALAAEQASISGQLEAAVLEQQAARAQAAALAVQAAGGNAAQPPSDPPLNAFLRCVVQAESGGNYAAVSPNGLYMGAFQFDQSTWNLAARLAGLPGLIGVPPNEASKAAQDTLAVALYNAEGEAPWYDPCRHS